ncbi:hypothetical protein ABZ783_13430 [Micromonospora sp. NPDC047738]|uniref:hypothetical protein n=1 Tax=Micromonospora sp. NPDC047738 TaxID=3155741 RepID=UPI00340C1EE7
MDAALAGLVGTTVGALAGVAGAWLAQRGQTRLQQEQRTYEERVRWLDDKRLLYRDLLIALYGWHDALVSVWDNDSDGTLPEARDAAYKCSVEATLIAPEPVRSAVEELRGRFFAAQPVILERTRPAGAKPPLAAVREGLSLLTEAMRADLSSPQRTHVTVGQQR